jgi:hypothetical protein
MSDDDKPAKRPSAVELYTMEETAEQLRVSRRWLQDFIKEHPFYRMAGRKKLFTANDIRDLHQAMPAPEAPRVFVRQIGGARHGQSKTHWKDVIARIQRDQEAEKAARRAKREQEKRAQREQRAKERGAG